MKADKQERLTDDFIVGDYMVVFSKIKLFMTITMFGFCLPKAFCSEGSPKYKDLEGDELVNFVVSEHQEEIQKQKLALDAKRKRQKELRKQEQIKKAEERRKKPKESWRAKIIRKWQERADRKAYFAELNFERREYHKRNLLHSPQKYGLAVKIADISSKMMEKHYGFHL